MEKPVDTQAVLTELKKVQRIFSPPDLKQSIEHRKLRAGIAMEVGEFFKRRHTLKVAGKPVGRRSFNIYMRKLIVDKYRESAFVYKG